MLLQQPLSSQQRQQQTPSQQHRPQQQSPQTQRSQQSLKCDNNQSQSHYNESASTLVPPHNTLVVNKPSKSYTHAKSKRKQCGEIIGSPSLIDKTIEQQLQQRRPALSISPIPKPSANLACCNSTSENTGTKTTLTEEKKLKDISQ